MLCPQLKQNLESIKTLKSELDLELPKIEKLFKDLKTDSRKGKEHKSERKDLLNKIKEIETKINSEVEKIEAELPTKKIEVGKEFNLKFKYRKLEEMIKAGNFFHANGDITPTKFSDPKEKELLDRVIRIKAKIFDFKKDISSHDVLKELDKEGYRPATLIELLALAEIDPELQRQFSIVSLGSPWEDYDDHYTVPYIYTIDSERKLNLDDFLGDWSVHYCFFAVRKDNN